MNISYHDGRGSASVIVGASLAFAAGEASLDYKVERVSEDLIVLHGQVDTGTTDWDYRYVTASFRPLSYVGENEDVWREVSRGVD